MICGCSYSAPSSWLQGTSWGEKLASKLNWELVNLARQGCGNGGIRIQVDEVIKQRPDFAIITPTFWDRIEIPVNGATTVAEGIDLQSHLQNNRIMNGYDPAIGIDNLNYGENNYRMISETIFSLASNNAHFYRKSKIPKDTQLAIKYFLNYIYDSNWKQQTDKWLMIEAAMELVYENIPFLFVPQILWFNSEHIDRYARMIGMKYFLVEDSMSQPAVTTLNQPTGEDPGYHGSELSQEIIANNFFDIIKARWQI